MKNKARLLLIALGVIGLTLSCKRQPTPVATESSESSSAEYVNDLQFQPELLRIAAEYRQWDLRGGIRWAPELCRIPRSRFRHSDSTDTGTHGRKLFLLFTKFPDAYFSEPDRIGQALVKEAYSTVSVPGPAPKNPHLLVVESSAAGNYAVESTLDHDGETFMADEIAGLYIMYRTAPDTPGTDDGWVYGTVTADGKTVTSAGRVASCMSCHATAPHGRLFGDAEDDAANDR